MTERESGGSTRVVQIAGALAGGKPAAREWSGPGWRRLAAIASPIAVLALWQGAGMAGWMDVRFFPPPLSIMLAFFQALKDGTLLANILASLSRILIGFVVGAVPGVIIGIVMGLSPMFRAALQPLVNATFPIPKIAILPLFILIFGLGEGSKYAVIAVAVIYPVLINTFEGVRNIDRIYLDVGRNFGAGRWRTFRDIAIPGALPNILAGLRLGLGIALLVIVAAEFSGAHTGIGYMIWNSWQTFEVDLMYVGLASTALLGFAFAALFNLLETWVIPWKRAR